ncbi:DEAD/DEAH box helicase family protein [Erwinia psidii]|uniref:AAA family ATPase n=1 Tax=Erwinia psidii TaxID=69224 RepID=A0A3N6SFF0_9GAMM|nr:AAA family ATPase [Erwinia psidii]MCX8956884.1 AAA family ATPase [Erwinia psidii]MCX8960305.1 AAA family ATPase [Erwinia psidii]MCX8964515.1 AAA family ATPase [Erwinia psidii]RQM40200.1 AAA family ATPase [Erwinia psidii]
MRKLIFIYGPPAVGKLTVSRLLMKKMEAILFHNHMTYDLAMELLAPDSEFSTIRRFACQLRLDAITRLFEESARELITTFCYEGNSDNWYIEEIKRVCTEHGITPFFVQLCSDDTHLLNRVENADRRQFGKVNTQGKLREILKNCDYGNAIDATHHRTFYTSSLAPQQVVERLMHWFYPS